MMKHLISSLKKTIVQKHINKQAVANGGGLAIFSLDKPDKNVHYRHLLEKILVKCNGLILTAEGAYEGKREVSYVMYFDVSSHLKDLASILSEADQDSFILYSPYTGIVNLVALEDQQRMRTTHWCSLDDMTTEVDTQPGYIAFPMVGSLLREVKFSFLFKPVTYL